MCNITMLNLMLILFRLKICWKIKAPEEGIICSSSSNIIQFESPMLYNES